MNEQQARDLFAQHLRSHRTQRGLTQEELASKVGKTVEHISFLERGERSPSFEMLFELAAVLGVAPHALIEQPQQLDELPQMLGIAPVEIAPEPVVQRTDIIVQQQTDIERLNAVFSCIGEVQKLADEYGIRDILQDNGGKVLQVLILLGLKVLPGREGNDAIDAEGNEYELKTVNRSLNKNVQVTTHHHLNLTILSKYRQVKAWYIAIYEGVQLKEIYRVLPATLEPLFKKWEARLATDTHLNNPKISMAYIVQGERVYTAT